jgi:hypothetical protein
LASDAASAPNLAQLPVDLPPAVRILSQFDQPVPPGSSITVMVDAEDDAGLTEIALFVDGKIAAAKLLPAPFKAVAVQFALEIPRWRAGTTFLLQAQATDTAGQKGQSDPTPIGVSRDDPPEIVLVAPVDGAEVLEGEPVRLRANVADDDLSGTITVTFLVNDSPVFTDFVGLAWFGEERIAEGVFVVPPASEGSILRVAAFATDTAGQVTFAPEVSLVVISRDLALERLIHEIELLVKNGLLGRGLGQALVVRLNTAERLIGTQNFRAAAALLQGITRELRMLAEAHQLTEAQAKDLIAQTTRLRETFPLE